MKNEYSSDDLLPLSGIQHFLFCRRQWALIHIEQQWKENVLTVEGHLLHKRVDDPFFDESRKDLLVARAVPVASYRLGLTGICDVVEFTASPDGVRLPGREDLFLPCPVEYKRGHEKHDPCDEAQLCAQAMCLEEMLSVEIPFGYLYYGQPRRRLAVGLGGELRALVEKMSAEMHAYFERGYTPRVKISKACRSCSLADLCLPELESNHVQASRYIREQLETS